MGASPPSEITRLLLDLRQPDHDGAQSLVSWRTAKSWYARGIGTMQAMQGDGTLAQWQVDEIAGRLRSAASPDSALLLLAEQR